MGHSIQIIVGKEIDLARLANRWVYARACKLAQGFAAIPMTDELFDDIAELINSRSKRDLEVFERFSNSHFELLERESHRTQLAYLETEYFGGLGTQSAILFANGSLKLGPLQSETTWDQEQQEYKSVPLKERAINRVLRELGVSKANYLDEFQALGLMNYRWNEDFTD